MNERAVFLKFELFAKRLNKLIDMFTTIHQFSSLEQHTHIAGVQRYRTCSACTCSSTCCLCRCLFIQHSKHALQ